MPEQWVAGAAVKSKNQRWVTGRLFKALTLVASVSALLLSCSAWAAPDHGEASQEAHARELGRVGSLVVERFGEIDARAMGWGEGEAAAMDEQALRLARRLESRRGLPSATVSMAKVKGEASSMARVEATGECRIVLARGPDAQRSGVDFKRLGLRASAEALGDANEQELLHELGHCRMAAERVSFYHPALTPGQNATLASTIFARDAARFDGVGRASGLFAEAHADAYMAIKWLEGKEFSESARESLRAVALFRQAHRDDQAEEGGGELRVSAHLSEDAVLLVLERADELSAMSPIELGEAARRLGSQSAVRMMARLADGAPQKWALMEAGWGMDLAIMAFSEEINAKGAKRPAPAGYRAEDRDSELGRALERLSAPARAAALRAGRLAGVDWSKGAEGLSEATAHRVMGYLAADAGLSEAQRREMVFLSPSGSLLKQALAALSEAQERERLAGKNDLPSFKKELARASWGAGSGFTPAAVKGLGKSRH